MAENTINVKVKQRTDTESNWASKNPVLLKGEMAISSDKNNKYKIGDGTSAWSVLSYAKADLSKSDVTTALGYTPPTTNTTYNDVTQSAHGLMTAADKKKLDGIASGATKVTVDSTLSSTSTNPVQNKVINSALTEKSNKNHTHDLSTMINTLSTGTATPIDDDYYISQYSGGGTTTTTYHRRPVKALFEYIKGKLSKVAVSGSYNDLSNKPAIPTVGNGTVTIKQAGTSKGTFSMNQSGNTTIELTDNNSWRGIQNNLTSTSTTDSLSANQGKILNESKLMHKTINTSKTDLNTLTETGIYHIVITDALNAPASNHGTLYVDTTVGTKYQVFMSDNVTNYMHKRYYDNTNKKWLGWTQLKLTDTVYTHPSHTAKSNGLYKITVDSTGHVSGTTAVTKSDITALGIPSTNTTYLTGTSSTSGLTKLYTGTGTATDGTMTQAAIKSSLDGKSDSSHTHNQIVNGSYGASVSSDGYVLPVGNSWIGKQGKSWDTAYITNVHGTADSAVKLATARTVSNTEDFVMSFSYDGSANSNANLRYYNSRINVGNTNHYPYHRFAKIDTQTGFYIDKTSTFLITQDYDGGGWGIVRISLRTNNSSSVSTVEAKWLVRCGLNADCVQIGLYNVFGKTYADAFFKTLGTYAGTVIRNLASGARGNIARTWTLIDSAEANDTTTSDKKTSTESYASTSTAATTLHSQAYTSVVVATDGGTVSYAISAGSVAWNNISGKPSTFTPSSHTHNYAGSSSAGGSANSLSYFQNTSSTNVGQAEGGSNAIAYISDYSGTALTSGVKDGALYRQAYSTSWVHQIYGDYRTGQIAVRGKNNGAWQNWRRVLDESNYKTFCTPANIGAAAANHSHSNYLTGINKSMVINALGYTPPTTDTNTWRGVQNNLTSTATDQSLSAYQGKVLKDLVDTKTTFTYSSTQPNSPASNAVWIG